MNNFLYSRKTLVFAGALLFATSALVFVMSRPSLMHLVKVYPSNVEDENKMSESSVIENIGVTIGYPQQVISRNVHPPKRKKDYVNNTGAISFLRQYEILFTNGIQTQFPADPNKPKTITKWWEAAAMIDWYINSPLRYECQNKMAMGNWHICQDPPYTVKPPCLVYSFGIAYDFTFDDDMARLGCEVHSFDPSMKMPDQKRGPNSTFHNMGISNTNTDSYNPRKDPYVQDRQIWRMRTVKSIMKELGHENKVIDVFKMDVESYEWAIIDNMMETNVFKYIRQFMTEFHLFPDFPEKLDYVYLYQIYTRLREMGLQEFSVGPHPKNLDFHQFNNQGDSEFVNTFFDYKTYQKNIKYN